MKTGEAEVWLRNELKIMYEEREAAQISAMIMEKITGLNRMGRLVKKEDPLVVQQLHLLTSYHHRLMQHEPVQYILGEVYFYGLKLFVDNAVLIPRPETEELVDWIVKDVKNKMHKSDTLKVIDIGTGSGCIALAIKKALPFAEVWGCDNSNEALNIARRNGAENNVRVDFAPLDFLNEAQQAQLPTVDIIVSNPPYIPEKDKINMHKNVLEHEPHTALFVPDNNPLIFYSALASFSKIHLADNGALYVEIHEDLGGEVESLFTTNGFKKVEIKKDMQGKDRMIKAQKE